MNILFVSAYDAPRGQSARTYTYAKRLVEMGHDVTFITNGFNHFSRKEYLEKNEKYRIEIIDGIRTIWIKTYPYKTNGLDRFINMFTNAVMSYYYHSKSEVSPDIVVGPSVPPFTALSAYYIAKKNKAKFIFEIRDPWPEILIQMGNLTENSIVSRIFRVIAKFLYKNSDRIITTLNNIDSILEDASVSPTKAIHLLNPISLYNTNNNVNINCFLVTYVGGFGFGQDIETMLEATKFLDAHDIYFKFVGVPENLLDKLRIEYGSEKVKFYPVVKKEDVHDILINSSLLISAHKDDGAFKYGINSNKLHDYLIAGRPIIFAANAPGNPIDISKAGIRIEPENSKIMSDTILYISNLSKEEREIMGDNGIKYAKENLDVIKLSKKLEDIFNETIKGNNKC